MYGTITNMATATRLSVLLSTLQKLGDIPIINRHKPTYFFLNPQATTADFFVLHRNRLRQE